MQRNALLIACLLISIMAGTGLGLAQEYESKGKPQEQGQNDEMQEMMAEYMKYATPGEHHGYLKALVGHWDLKGKVRTSAEAPWQDFHSESDLEWILGERFLTETVRGEPSDWMPTPFEGFRVLGYDNYKQKYTSVWMDNFGTMMSLAEGTVDSTGMEFTFDGSWVDPVLATKKTYTMVYKTVNDDEFLFQQSDMDSDGKPYLSIDITYTRKNNKP